MDQSGKGSNFNPTTNELNNSTFFKKGLMRKDPINSQLQKLKDNSNFPNKEIRLQAIKKLKEGSEGKDLNRFDNSILLPDIKDINMNKGNKQEMHHHMSQKMVKLSLTPNKNVSNVKIEFGNSNMDQMRISYKKSDTNFKKESEESNSDFSNCPEYLETEVMKDTVKLFGGAGLDRDKYQSNQAGENNTQFMLKKTPTTTSGKLRNFLTGHPQQGQRYQRNNSRGENMNNFSFEKSFTRQSTDFNNQTMIHKLNVEMTAQDEESGDNDTNYEGFRKGFSRPLSGVKAALINRKLNSSVAGLHDLKYNSNNLNKSTNFSLNKNPIGRIKQNTGDMSMNNSNQHDLSFSHDKNEFTPQKSIKSRLLNMKLINSNKIQTNISFELNSSITKSPSENKFKKKPTIKSFLQESFSIDKTTKTKEKLAIYRENEISILKSRNFTKKNISSEVYQLNITNPEQKEEVKDNGLALGIMTVSNTNTTITPTNSNSTSNKNMKNFQQNSTLNNPYNKTLTFNKQTLNFSNNLLNESTNHGHPESSYIEDLHFQFVKMMIQMKNLVNNIESQNLANSDERDFNTVVPVDEMDLD